MSPLSKRVVAVGMQGILQKANPATIEVAHFFDLANDLRDAFAQLIHAPSAEHIAVLPAASYGLAIVAQNTPMPPGSNIVVLHEQFPSNMYSWRRIAAERGISLRTVTPPDQKHDRGHAWNLRLLEAIDAQTALVALPHVHWADGTLFDLAALRQRTQDIGAAFVIDGTQSVGALPLDVTALQPDALICAGYKWLMGPYSIGVGYFGPRYHEGIPLEENWINRRNSENFSALVNYQDAYQPGALRYDVGERSNFILVPMLTEGIRQVLEWEVEAIQAYCVARTAPVVETAAALGFQVEAPTQRAAHLFGLRMPAGLPVEAFRQMLSERGISVSIRGNALRVSPHVYNDDADLVALCAALQAAVV